MGSPPTSLLAVMLRVIQLTVIVLTLAIFITMLPFRPVLSASLLLVTSQARLESDVLEPQSGVTAGFAVCSRLCVVRTVILRSLLTSLNRLGFL